MEAVSHAVYIVAGKVAIMVHCGGKRIKAVIDEAHCRQVIENYNATIQRNNQKL